MTSERGSRTEGGPSCGVCTCTIITLFFLFAGPTLIVEGIHLNRVVEGHEDHGVRTTGNVTNASSSIMCGTSYSRSGSSGSRSCTTSHIAEISFITDEGETVVFSSSCSDRVDINERVPISYLPNNLSDVKILDERCAESGGGACDGYRVGGCGSNGVNHGSRLHVGSFWVLCSRKRAERVCC